MQFSLKWLLAAIAFIAVSLVALLNANDLWRVGFKTAVIFSVYVALLGALFSFGNTRVFSAGYAIVALCFFTRFFGADWSADLITQDALSAIHSQAFSFTEDKVQNFHPFTAREVDGDIVGTPVRNSDGSATMLVVRPKERHFVEVGHVALSVVLGVMGGFIAVAFYWRRPMPAI